MEILINEKWKVKLRQINDSQRNLGLLNLELSCGNLKKLVVQQW